jgi:hypothetical protein
MSQIIPIYIPTYISDQNYNPSRVLPRLFFYNGLVECEQYYIESGSVNQYGISQAQTAFPYFDNYNVVSGSFPTETSRTLLFNNEAPSYGAAPTASLYTEYWEDYISLLYNPRTRLLNCSAIIPLADYVKMELNDVVNFRGNYYHLRAINDYSLKDGTCSLQLLGPIISDTLSGPPLPPPPPAFVSWSYSEISQDGTFTITNNGNPVATLTANGTGSSEIDAGNTIIASLAPVNFPSSGSVTMSLNVNGGTTLSVSSSTNTTISSSFIVNTGQTYNITGSIRFNAPPTYSIDYLVVAGGGGGGTGTGGGGGAGGLKSGSFDIINNQTIPVVVGLGGAAGANGESSSISSSFSGFISASGGGFGGYGTTTFQTGSVGGSGGGGTGGISALISGSLGIAGEGFTGGVGRQRTGQNQSAGGGGGASLTGSSYQPTDVPSGGGNGGSGSLWLNGVFYAGGGGGWYSGTGDRAGLGGTGGGGRGAADGTAIAVTGSVNTGGGGGGGNSTGTYIAKGGGSGVVILRYSNSNGQIANGGTVTNTGGFFYHAFTGSGNFTTI